MEFSKTIAIKISERLKTTKQGSTIIGVYPQTSCTACMKNVFVKRIVLN